MLTRIFSHIFLFVIFDAPLVQPVDVNFVAVEAEGQPYIVGNGGIAHIVCIQTVVGLIFFSPVTAENALKRIAAYFFFITVTSCFVCYTFFGCFYFICFSVIFPSRNIT